MALHLTMLRTNIPMIQSTQMFAFVGRGGVHSAFGSHRQSAEKPFRKGIVFTTIAVLVLVSGVTMTVLGFTDVFGSGITMLGMLMIAIAILQGLYGLRMFLIAAKYRQPGQTLQISRGTVASMVIEREDERGTLTVVMDAVNIQATCCRRTADENRPPPDYNEATSDFCPETSADIVVDSEEDNPPPYGPPTYDQAIYDKQRSSVTSDLNPQHDQREDLLTNINQSDDGTTFYGNNDLQNMTSSNRAVDRSNADNGYDSSSNIRNTYGADRSTNRTTDVVDDEGERSYSGPQDGNVALVTVTTPRGSTQDQPSHYQDLPSVTL